MQVLLASRPQGWVKESDFRIVEAPIPQSKDGEVLVKHLYLSLDPYMRGRMNDAKSYAAGVGIGDVMVGEVVGEVIEARHPDYRVGDLVLGRLGWQLYATSNGQDLRKIARRRLPLSAYLGVVGMPAATAWIGLYDIGEPKAGETVVVSAAAGAVGSLVGQLAKIRGCRAGGIAGGKTKCDHVVQEPGFDACADYKAGNLVEDLAAATPDGIGGYFENVGGDVFKAVLPQLNAFARIPLCGLVTVQRHRTARHAEHAQLPHQAHQAAGLHLLRPDGTLARGAGADREMGARGTHQVSR